MLRIDNPPAYFNLGMNKDPNDPGRGGDHLDAKSGNYASVAAR